MAQGKRDPIRRTVGWVNRAALQACHRSGMSASDRDHLSCAYLARAAPPLAPGPGCGGGEQRAEPRGPSLVGGGGP